MVELPAGTVTFLFTDIEGSTRLLHELGDAYADALAEHRRVLRDAFARYGGVEVDTQGDASFVAFPRATEALAAARDAQTALQEGPVRVRIGLHTGEPLLTNEGYVGIDVHRAARIAAAGHGGQILMSQSTRDLIGADGPRDLGEHRLKDLTAPERIYQLGDGEFPPLKSLNQTNLPVQPSPLVGRERELRDVLELLRSSRFLTLTGAGGSGKTRLALQAAAEVVEEFPHGVWFVSLASLRDMTLVESTISHAIGARDDLAQFLRGRKPLLLLDNLEHLLPEIAPWIAQLDARVLATSRERLNIASEQEYPVPTLPVKDAVALFTQRARQLNPTFEADEHVAEIARRVDGLPLAVELAAARTKVLRPREILDRLGHSLDLLTSGTRDAPERQWTLRATIAWSYELLDDGEQRMFANLGVFAGSFDLEAADAVAGADIDLLQALVDKSLLRQTEEGRFFLLETVWEYARELFAAAEAAVEVRRRHAAHFARLVDSRAKRVMSGDPVATKDVAAAYADIRTALQFSLDDLDFARAVVIADGMWWFWISRGLNREGYEWIRRIERHRQALDPEHDLRFIGAAGELARFAGALDRAIAWKTEEAELLRQSGNAPERAAVLADLAHIFAERHEFERAEDFAKQALSIRRQIGEPGGIAHALGGLGHVLLVKQNYAAAREIFETVLEMFEAAGWKALLADVHVLVAACLRREGAIEGAARHLRDALSLALEHERWTDAPEILGEVAEVALARSDPLRAAVLTAAEERLVGEFGRPLEVTFGNPSERAASIRATIGSDAYDSAAARGVTLDLPAALEEALAALD